MPDLIDITVPAYFWVDHRDRDLPAGQALSDTGEYKRRVLIRATPAEVAEIREDAEYYCDAQGFDPEIQRTVCGWARSMLKALARQGY